MDVYHIWCNLRPGVSDLDFCESVDQYLGKFALYRDFSDPNRERGGEKF